MYSRTNLTRFSVIIFIVAKEFDQKESSKEVQSIFCLPVPIYFWFAIPEANLFFSNRSEKNVNLFT